jgi:hypothetical protein
VVEHVEVCRGQQHRRGQFLLAAGNAGIEAATNIVVKQANHEMLFWCMAR